MKNGKRKKTPTGDYPVGYCRPPKDTRFQPGRSAYPKGRPKGTRNFDTELEAALGRTVDIPAEGKSRRMSKRALMIEATLNRAIKGDMRAVALIIQFEERRRARNPEPESEAPEVAPEDEEILKGFLDRHRPPSDGEDPSPSGEK